MNHQTGCCLRTGNDDLLAQEKSRDDVWAPVEVVVHLGVLCLLQRGGICVLMALLMVTLFSSSFPEGVSHHPRLNHYSCTHESVSPNIQKHLLQTAECGLESIWKRKHENESHDTFLNIGCTPSVCYI